jgi:hypothetical protein
MFFQVRNSLATIKGLCQLGRSDNATVSTGQYIEKIDTVSDQLLGAVDRNQIGIGTSVF